MSDLGVVGATDLSALNYNPSLLAVNNKTQLSFTHTTFPGYEFEMFAGVLLAGFPLSVEYNQYH